VAVLPLGAFERGMSAARRGFERSGLGRAFGQDPAQRRAVDAFSGGGGFRVPSGRPDFARGGIFGGSTGSGSRSSFGGGSVKRVFGSDDDAFGQDTLFGDIRWDPNTGLRIKGDALGGAGGYGGLTGDAAVDMAAQRNGLPASVLRAMVQRESSNDWASNSGVRCDIRTKADGTPDCMVPYTGIFASTAESWGISFDSLRGNQQAQLDAMARIFAGIKQQHGFTTWEDTAAYYFAGPNWNNPNWADENRLTVAQYRAGFNADVARYAYGGMAGVSPGGGTGVPAGPGTGTGYGSGGWSSALWGNQAADVSYEFNAPSVNGDMYGYGAAHGTNGWSHPGVDVAVPWGTTLYATKSGTVSCVGSADAGIGGTGGGSCGYFCVEGGGSGAGCTGNVTVRFDDGTYLVYGHTASSLVQPGQRVTAGQAVARSGGLQGDHVHFEYRVKGNCASGYCVADPRQIGQWSGGGYTPAPQAPVAVNGAPYSPGYTVPTRLAR